MLLDQSPKVTSPLTAQSTVAVVVWASPVSATRNTTAAPSLAEAPPTRETAKSRTEAAFSGTVTSAVPPEVTAPPPEPTCGVVPSTTRIVSAPSSRPSCAGVKLKSALRLPAGISTMPLAATPPLVRMTPPALLNS